jgi:monoterpene epsilon-lactone hydrolase
MKGIGGSGLAAGIFLLCACGVGQQMQGQTATAAHADSSVIGSDGTAYVTRIVPVPASLSPEAQKLVGRPASDAAVPQTLAERRSHTDTWQTGAGEAFRKFYPVNVTEATIAGVPTKIVMPLAVPANKRNRVLINLHGGGFNSDSGSLTESIPMAYLTQTKVVAVLYRLAPEHPFPAAVDDAVAVYRELLKTYKPEDIGLYGTSAGAILTGEVAVKLRELKLPLPAALGIFSGQGDFSRDGDSQSLYALNGFSGHLDPPKPKGPGGDYAGNTDLRDPVLSPVFANLHGMPPTLFITSTRDLLLSGTTTLHRAFLNAGVDARLIVFDGLAHAFWNDLSLPETKEAHKDMAHFFDQELGK